MQLRKTSIITFIKFLFVGAGGSITNLTIFFLLVDQLNFQSNPVIVFAFLSSASQNYFFNNFWTFKNNQNNKLLFNRYIKYLLVCSISLLSNLIIFNFIDSIFSIEPRVITQFISIAFGTIINFLGANFFVFKK